MKTWRQTYQNLWLAVLFQFEDGIDEWIEAEILAWGQNHLADLIANFVDGAAERLVDEAYANMIDDFPRQQILRQIAQCEARLRQFDAEGERFSPIDQSDVQQQMSQREQCMQPR